MLESLEAHTPVSPAVAAVLRRGIYMNQVIASREFQVGRTDSVIRVKVAAPILDPSDNRWTCEFLITGHDVDLRSFADGVDSLHALLSCIETVRIVVNKLQETHSLRWLDSDDLGMAL